MYYSVTVGCVTVFTTLFLVAVCDNFDYNFVLIGGVTGSNILRKYGWRQYVESDIVFLHLIVVSCVDDGVSLCLGNLLFIQTNVKTVQPLYK